MGEPRVAVVIPVRDGAALVLDAVASVRAQGTVVAEVVAVDNGSTDRTAEVLAAVGVRVITEDVPGAGAARRRGLADTTERYVMFLDHDDVLHDGALAALVARVDATGADLVYGRAVNEAVEGYEGADGLRHLQSAQAAPISSAVVVDRRAFDRFGPMADDNFSWGRWLLAAQRAGANVESLDVTVCTRRIHGANVSLQPGSQSAIFAMIREHRRAVTEPPTQTPTARS